MGVGPKPTHLEGLWVILIEQVDPNPIHLNVVHILMTHDTRIYAGWVMQTNASEVWVKLVDRVSFSLPLVLPIDETITSLARYHLIALRDYFSKNPVLPFQYSKTLL